MKGLLSAGPTPSSFPFIVLYFPLIIGTLNFKKNIEKREGKRYKMLSNIFHIYCLVCFILKTKQKNVYFLKLSDKKMRKGLFSEISPPNMISLKLHNFSFRVEKLKLLKLI